MLPDSSTIATHSLWLKYKSFANHCLRWRWVPTLLRGASWLKINRKLTFELHTKLFKGATQWFAWVSNAESRRPVSPKARQPVCLSARRRLPPPLSSGATRCFARRSRCSDAAVREWRCYWPRPTQHSARDTDVAVPLLIHWLFVCFKALYTCHALNTLTG